MEEIVSREQGLILLQLARQTIGYKLGIGEKPAVPPGAVFQQKYATFVTLKKKGKLRGCIGNLVPVGSLLQGVQDNARSAAFHDHRFSRISLDELDSLQIDISVLSEPEPLFYTDTEELISLLRPGIDGLILRDGQHRATFLPQVWKQLPEPEMFLDQLCVKAGLARGLWREKKIEFQIYQVQEIVEDSK